MIDGRRRRPTENPPGATADGSRSMLARALSGTGRFLVRRGVSADLVTAVGVVIAAGAAVVIGLGHLWTGVALITVGGLMDTLDGVVAKAAASSSARGAFVDSVADRVSDCFIFSGVAWYLLDGRDPKAAILPVAILGVSSVVSYTRAKAESLGFDARGGLMERAERLILLAVALAFHVVLVPLLVALLVLTSATAVGRFRRVWAAASAEREAPVAPSGVEAAWRNWRARSSLHSARRRSRARSRELQPLATRLRRVWQTPESGRPQRAARRRERSTLALRRRLEAER